MRIPVRSITNDDRLPRSDRQDCLFIDFCGTQREWYFACAWNSENANGVQGSAWLVVTVWQVNENRVTGVGEDVASS